MTEIWRDIAGYEGYQVSNFGRVWSFKGKTPRITKGSVDTTRGGYLRVGLCRNGKIKFAYVHRLVALAFIPNPEGKREVNHINGDKSDNRVENLEWCTSSENKYHAVAWGLRKSGENNSRAKFTNEQARYVRDNPDGLTQRKLADKFGVSKAAISQIQHGRTYGNAGGKIRAKINRRIPDEIRAEIKRLYIYGSREFGSTALAKKFGVTPAAIRKIVHEN